MSIFSRVIVPALIAAFCFAGPQAARAQTASAGTEQPSEDTWNSIKGDLFKNRPILDGSGLVILDAPRRAEDAALVPIGMRVKFADDDKRTLQSLTLVIDENPAPVAGTFTIGPRAGVTSISTRIRVNSYSYVRVVAELSDGKLYGVKAYVKASGGCSAPAASNADAANAVLGQMKFRTFRSEPGAPPEAQLMVRHPQNSGLQMDQLTRLYVPPFFIDNLKIWQGDDLIVAMDGGIAIAEDPNIRFNYKPNGASNFRTEAVDTSKHIFRDEWTIEKSML
ncbi:quinoprotein dehydrogenase-associated SoxYZ-like carrier [Bradyrhizobium canariense]|uniref:Sulfur-oxidizing protein SoxY n=1 Tax=Bradyrhizobium canariense TaxID=255045 RepID=A0A1H1ULE9_9BRAD|nr:quinoprotein dehydrogenase-associated SoxYZ-like carrier [Bradyrhizobium canariense]SDS73150.1 sulfur-oxidizing protein SoxY [Bradyrhizobium canariense]